MVVKELVLENDKEEKFEVEVYINLASIRGIERELKAIDKSYNFYSALPLVDKGELTLLLIYLCNCVHVKGNKNPVGFDWFDDHNIDFLKYSKELSEAFAKCLIDNKGTVQSKGK